MIKSRTSQIDIDRIKVSDCIKKSLPKPDKIEQRYRFYKQTGEFDREIIIDEEYNLVDGYSTYLICKMLDIQKVRALRIIVDDEQVKELEKKLEESNRLLSEVYEILGKVVETC
jgi:hypothetical protein